jgi:hypothetical protein
MNQVGQKMKLPFELCSRNLERPMYPLMVYMCFFCQKTSSERECFETSNGRIYLTIPLCARCVQYNKISQEAGRQWLAKCQQEIINMDFKQ